MKKGQVLCDDKLCGYITQNDDNTFVFEYTDEWYNDSNSKSVSLTLSKTTKKYESNILFPFFDGLIPEGYLLEVALKKFNISHNDRMELLLKTCSDPIGNISVREAGNE